MRYEFSLEFKRRDGTYFRREFDISDQSLYYAIQQAAASEPEGEMSPFSERDVKRDGVAFY